MAASGKLRCNMLLQVATVRQHCGTAMPAAGIQSNALLSQLAMLSLLVSEVFKWYHGISGSGTLTAQETTSIDLPSIYYLAIYGSGNSSLLLTAHLNNEVAACQGYIAQSGEVLDLGLICVLLNALSCQSLSLHTTQILELSHLPNTPCMMGIACASLQKDLDTGLQ